MIRLDSSPERDDHRPACAFCGAPGAVSGLYPHNAYAVTTACDRHAAELAGTLVPIT